LAQTGGAFWPGRAAPDWGRIDPFQGLSRLEASGTRLIAGLAQFLVAAGVASVCWHTQRESWAAWPELPAEQWLPAMRELLNATLGPLLLTLLGLGALDYVWQRWLWERGLNLSPEEARQEQRELDGDPQIKGRRREVLYQFLGRQFTILWGLPEVHVILGGDLALVLQGQLNGPGSVLVLLTARGAHAERLRISADEHKIPQRMAPELVKRLWPFARTGRNLPPAAQGIWAAWQNSVKNSRTT